MLDNKKTTTKGTHAKTKKNYVLPFTFLFLGGLLIWGNLADSDFILFSGRYVPRTRIGEIQQKREAGSTVYIKGKVESIAPFLGSGAYQVQDSTGSIWVLSNQSIPESGERVVIKGKIQYQSIPVGSNDLGEFYIQEQLQL